MPIEIIELFKLIIGLILIIIPGYLWSFFLFKNIKRLERIVFALISSICLFSLGLFTLDIILGITITKNVILLIFTFYTIPVLILYGLSIYRFGFKKPDINFFKNPKYFLLLLILIFTAFMVFLPHFKDGYFLPFHVDEWIHWSYSKSIQESGSSIFTDPYIGSGITRSLEPGFHYIVASISWISGSNFLTMFVFMPSIIAIFTSLTLFNIGERKERKFGLEAAFIVSFIPTTCRMMGPSFFVSVSVGLFIITFIIWFLQQEKILLVPFIPIIIFSTFLIHPPTALAEIIITIVYALLLLFNKQYKLSILNAGSSLIPAFLVLILSTRWESSINKVIDAFLGGKYSFDYNLPEIWVSFEHMGVIIWIMSVIGVFFAFSKGKKIVRTVCISAIAFISIIGLYSKFGYGIPIMYERSFMYLFLMVVIIAGWGLSEIRRSITKIFDRLKTKKYYHVKKFSGIIVSIIVCLTLITTTIPKHLEISYYHMIQEKDYENFIWIEKNIDSFRDDNNSYDRGVVDPFYASPFSSLTGLYILSSNMHPIYNYNLHFNIIEFLDNSCENTSFLDKYKISVIYTKNCDNENLTLIHSNVYLYSGLI